MRREPSLTFRGALEILGHHDRPTIEKLDRILGGVILASGEAAGVAAVDGAPLAPLGLWAATWGWTDAAVGLLRKALDSATGKLNGTRGYQRRQLIAAVHTTSVVAAFLEAFQEEVGEDAYDELKISDEQKTAFLTGGLREAGASLFNVLYAVEVPEPSPSRALRENEKLLRTWMSVLAADFDHFLTGLSSTVRLKGRWERILDQAIERYRSKYLELAARVPEFLVWALLEEHVATQTLVRQHGGELAAALDRPKAAMARLEALLALAPALAPEVTSGPRAIVDRLNRAVLDQPIFLADDSPHGPGPVFPPVSRMYINPRFRVRELDLTDRDVRVADERWWNELPSRADFDLLLSAYVTTPHATRRPMLLLGGPGSGKSLLTKVLAARLSGAGYTVVRVPLRRVGASAPIVAQIEQSLYESTAKHVNWTDLTSHSVGTIRVVLLDGLDELLHASGSYRSGYLQEVADFQDREAAQERPLVVIVTSRIVVADQVGIPDGTVAVKLDPFTEEDIDDWLERWQEANSRAIASGRVRALTADAAHRQPDLARQPLLLMMLAIYAADPALPPLDTDLSTADLYRSILTVFARREERKALGDYARGPDLEGRIQDQLDRLAIAALGMFNRGRHDISEDELGRDLQALGERPLAGMRPDEAGQRIVGEFFFTHVSETLAARPGGQPRSGYEFVDATFGEYLVASRVMDELREVAVKAFAGRRGPSVPEDDRLFALLSHQPLADRASILTFAGQIVNSLIATERTRLVATLEMLLETYRARHGSDRYAAYRPTPPDTIRELTCYAANLESLRTVVETPGGGTRLYELGDVFKMNGVPGLTFVEPADFARFLMILRQPGRGVVIEGPSGIGKTTFMRRAEQRERERGGKIRILSARKRADLPLIRALPDGHEGIIAVDDFHRLDPVTRDDLSDYLKLLADEESESRLIIIGIPGVGKSLVDLSFDLATRIEVFRLTRAPDEAVKKMIEKGEQSLNVFFSHRNGIISMARGSLLTAQMLCWHVAQQSGIERTVARSRELQTPMDDALRLVRDSLAQKYAGVVRKFSMLDGERDRLCVYLLKKLAQTEEGILSLDAVASERPDLTVGIEAHLLRIFPSGFDQRHDDIEQHLSLDPVSRQLIVEDPQFLFYLRGLDVDQLAEAVGKKPSRRQIFISYSHTDEPWMRKLKVHLDALADRGKIDYWSDKDIAPGQKWRSEIEAALDRAAAGVLLVTPKFLESDFIRDVEIRRLLERAGNGGCQIWALIVKPSVYKAVKELEVFQAFNQPSAPLSGMTTHKQDKMLSELALALARTFPAAE